MSYKTFLIVSLKLESYGVNPKLQKTYFPSYSFINLLKINKNFVLLKNKL